MLPTVAERGARAIAGDSMGGFGAMNVALGHPQRFAVVESWLGFFNGLSVELQAARPVIQREGLQRIRLRRRVRHIANPSEDAPFAAAAARRRRLRARGAVYAGEHDMQTLHAHLPHMLLFAGSALAQDIGTRRPAPGRPHVIRRLASPSRRSRAGAVGAASIGALAAGALAGGAVAIGALAIGRLAIRRAAIGSLKVGELEVGRLSVGELRVASRQQPAPTDSGGGSGGAAHSARAPSAATHLLAGRPV